MKLSDYLDPRPKHLVIGDRLMIDGDIYLICCPRLNHIVLIDKEGYRYDDEFLVHDHSNITAEEISNHLQAPMEDVLVFPRD